MILKNLSTSIVYNKLLAVSGKFLVQLRVNDIFEDTYSVTIQRDSTTGTIVGQFWRNAAGELENPLGPAITEYDPETSRKTSERWMVGNKTSRNESEGPAVIHYDREFGNPIVEWFFLNGEPFRTLGPAEIYKNSKTGKITSSKYHPEENTQILEP